MASTIFYLMITDLELQDAVSRPLLDEWFPLHFIPEYQGLAIGFYVAESQADVLETILKAQLFSGLVVLLPGEDEFIRLLGLRSEGNGGYEVTGSFERSRVVTVESWRDRMRLVMELEAADDLVMDSEGDELAEEQEGDGATLYYTADEGDSMSIDSSSVVTNVDNDGDDCEDDSDDDEDDDDEDDDDDEEDGELRELLDLVPLHPSFKPYECDRTHMALLDRAKLRIHEKNDLAFASSYGCLI
ncbi:hypothetical protein NDA16_003718 [Ustilago loliicola]|nr:hypothetical protein NDA16_003718 [Ustilago loliicola]